MDDLQDIDPLRYTVMAVESAVAAERAKIRAAVEQMKSINIESSTLLHNDTDLGFLIRVNKQEAHNAAIQAVLDLLTEPKP